MRGPDQPDKPRGGPPVPAQPTGWHRPRSVSTHRTRHANEADERDDALLRLRAEFDNYRKRMLRQHTAHAEHGAEELMHALLPVLDTADLALHHHPDAVGPVHRHLHQTLAAHGLERVEPLGARFDPAEHHAIEHQPAHDNVIQGPWPTSSRDAVVIAVDRPGYRYKRRLLRPALVRVRG